MDVGVGFYMYDVVVKKFTFAISSPDEFLFAELTIVTDRPIDRPRYAVCITIGRIYLVVRCGLIIGLLTTVQNHSPTSHSQVQ